jgi:hypothetical protein
MGLMHLREMVLAAVLVSAAFAGQAQAEKRVALVIGNGAYAQVQPLENPSNDATAIADAFRRLKFDGEPPRPSFMANNGGQRPGSGTARGPDRVGLC